MALVEAGTLVFVVDDDRDVRQVLAEVLLMEGYDVKSLPSADAAWIEIAHGAQPAVVIMDLWLPGMSSAELIQRLRRSACGRLPVIVLSGDRVSEQMERDVEFVLRKPVELTTLIRAIDRAARHNPQTSGTSRRTLPARRAQTKRHAIADQL
jgi:FixJ family two-component response regulator